MHIKKPTIDMLVYFYYPQYDQANFQSWLDYLLTL